MTELICGVSLSSSDEIELCVLKYLLTATCRPHISDAFALRETYLLQAVRVVYNVFLCTTSNPNRITARATLEHMIASVFARMEFYEKHNPDAPPPPPPPPSTANGNGNGNGNDKEKEQVRMVTKKCEKTQHYTDTTQPFALPPSSPHSSPTAVQIPKPQGRLFGISISLQAVHEGDPRPG